MAERTPRLFTIPASAPFLRTLVGALTHGELVPGFPASKDPLALAAATLYLPTRRACRLARDAFLAHVKNDAAILPRIVAIGDIDEDEIAFSESAHGNLAEEALALPPSLGGFERKILLTELVLKWAATIRPDQGAPLVANNPAAAMALADGLARLIDDMTTRNVPWNRLDDLVPDGMDVYWQLTLSFLKIAREIWPALLAERGAMESAARRDHLIAAEAARLQKSSSPVIAAGSTGSMPATAMLLATIAKLPHGAVVLPGLDQDLDEASWNMIGGQQDTSGTEIIPAAFGHPQFGLAALLRRLEVTRANVKSLCAPAPHGREMLISEALRPAAATERWQKRLTEKNFVTQRTKALAALTMIEAANAEEEALAIAIALREGVDDKDKSAALITPDRALARRVLAALERWRVPVDDSGGDPLSDIPAGNFALLTAQAALDGCEPVTLLALLKHPLFRLQADAFAHAKSVTLLERAVLRGPRPKPGSAGLAHALQSLLEKREDIHRNDPRSALSNDDLNEAKALVAKLTMALTPLETLAKKTSTLSIFAQHHRDAVIALSTDDQGEIAAFVQNEGAALADAFEDMIADRTAAALPIKADDYGDVVRATLADRMVRRPGAPASRVRILGPLEARLQQTDRVVLAGFIEGVWPPEAASDPWLSRPMRQNLGLDLPERRIGLSAHDFAQALGAPEIFLTRAAKREGAPAVASRFLQRLAAVAGDEWKNAQARGETYLLYARALDHPAEVKPAARPAPTPPVGARPTYLTVTEIEHWLRDPYTIYAKHILRLRPLDAVDTPPGARDRGTVIHESISEFTEKYPQKLPSDALGELKKIGERHFAALEDYPEARAFWWPRFVRIARWFIDWETQRRGNVAQLHAEIRGEIIISLGARQLRLAAHADRIERQHDGRFAILDYKTGRVPSDKEVKIGLAPQLTLEAAILRQGGFKDIAAGQSVSELVYVSLKGGQSTDEAHAVEFKDSGPDEQADLALAKLKAIALRFEDEKQPYHPLVLSMWRTRYGDYDHLARIKEWSATGGEPDDGSTP